MLILVSVTIVTFAVRLFLLGKLWPAPLKNGEGFFLSVRVKPDFYREAGAPLLRRYRVSLVIPLLIDAPLVVWLAFTRRYEFLVLEQVFLSALTVVLYNLMAVHFSYRAAAIVGEVEERPAILQLSVAPRRLRDHTNFAVEAVIVVATLLSLGLLARIYVLASAPGASHAAAHGYHRAILLTAWVLYWQIGFLLLKGVFVRWRMPLPSNRTEDFRRWRAAWLSHNLNIFDAVRLQCGLAMLGATAWLTHVSAWPRFAQMITLGVAILGMVVYFVYVIRESRRLAATARELKPIEMVKEFPRSPVAQGRYLAGGLLYFNRDNPGVIVRGVNGMAINLAHRSTYAWTAYFLGLVALMMWMAR
jgi:uncharacterized membrane protein